MTDDQAALVLEHDALAQRYASAIVRGLPPQIERDDILQAGRLGLCDAALRWRPDLAVPFHAYAGIRVRGAIFDWLRVNRGVSTHSVIEDGKVKRRRQAPIDQISVLEADVGFDTPAPALDYERRILVDQVLAHCDDLDRRDAFIVRASCAGHTHKAIGAALGVVESRVSQLYKAATQRLRRDLAA